MVAPTKGEKVDFDAVNSIADSDKKEQIAKTDKLKDKGAILASYTMLADFADFLYYEFTELLKQGLTLRKCKLRSLFRVEKQASNAPVNKSAGRSKHF